MMSSETQYRYRPGLLDFGLSASKAQGLYQLESQISTTKTLLTEYKGFESTEFAILNLQGALLYYKHEYEAACNIFKDIFKRSHYKNLNACINLEYVYHKLGYWTEAEKVKQNLVAEKDGQLQKHQCLREQAFAIIFDCHVSVQQYERFKRAVQLLESCSTFSDNEAGIEQQWKLWYAVSLQRLLGHCQQKESSEKLEYLNKGLNTLIEIIQSKDQTDCRILSMAYTYIGQFMYKAKAKNEEELIERVEQRTSMPVKQWHKNPEECFKEAMKLYVNAEVITRYALYLSGKGDVENLQNVVRLLEVVHGTKEEGIPEEKPEPEIGKLDVKENWFLLSVKCKTFLELGRKLEEKTKVCAIIPNSQTTASAGETDNAPTIRVSGDITVDGLKTTKTEFEECKSNGNNGENCISDGPMMKETDTQVKGDNVQSFSEDVSADKQKMQGQETGKPKRFEYSRNECIEKAILYGERAIKLNPAVDQFHNVGCAYQMKANIVEDKSEQRSMYFSALSYFLHALNHLDGSKIPYVHVSQGNCLLEMKQYRPAVECFKRAIAAKTRNKKIYHFLFKGYIELLREVWNNKTERIEIVKEIIYWLLQYTKSNGTEKGILGSLLELENLEPVAEGSLPKKHVVAFVIAEMLRNGIEMEDVKYALPDECLERKTQGCAQLAVEVLGALIEANHVDCTYRKYVLGLIDEEVIKQFPENVQEWLVRMLKESFCQCRETCRDRIDFSVLNIFKQVHESYPFVAEKVTTKMSETDDTFAKILLKYVEMPVNLESEQSDDVWASEALDQALHSGETAGLYLARLQRQVCRLESAIHQKQISPQTNITRRKSIPKVRQTKFDYDFFVLHSETDEDRKWVLFELLPTLECQFGFRGCVEERDSTPGTPRIQEMNKLHEKSFKILIILSKHYKTDPFCKFAMQNALFEKMGKNNVIPVLKDEIEIPDELRTIVFMSAVKNFDWERLVRALEAD